MLREVLRVGIAVIRMAEWGGGGVTTNGVPGVLPRIMLKY